MCMCVFAAVCLLTSSRSSSVVESSRLSSEGSSVDRCNALPLQSWYSPDEHRLGSVGSSGKSRELGWCREPPLALPAFPSMIPPGSSSSKLPLPSPESRDSLSPDVSFLFRLGARLRPFQLDLRLPQLLLELHGWEGDLRGLAWKKKIPIYFSHYFHILIISFAYHAK